MATFRYGSGAVTASKMVIVKDAVVNGSDVAFEVAQPAKTFLSGVFIKVNDAVAMSSGNVGFNIGDASGETDIFNDTDFFLASGTSIPANTVYHIPASDLGRQAAGQGSPALVKGYTDTARNLHAFIDNPSVSVTAAGTFEIHFQFTHFD